MILVRKSFFGILARPLQYYSNGAMPAFPSGRQAGGNPTYVRILHPDINVGVSESIMKDTANYLPRPLGRGLGNIKTIKGF
jgi:hypothetical protein